MPFRDLALFGVFAIVIPAMVWHPYIGALAWVVFGLMNPHRLAFGPAYDFPFSLIIGVITVMGIAFTRDHRAIKGGLAGWVLLVIAVWVSVTTLFALTPQEAIQIWSRVMKNFAMTFILMLLLHTRRHVDLLIAAIGLSIGFYGIKGGIFTIVHGGSGIVNGPEGSVVMGNTELAVANVMIIPLLLHAYQQVRNLSVRIILMAGMLLCVVAVLGSYSRGAFLALAAMGAFLWLRSSRKSFVIILLLLTALVLVPFMPDRWGERMGSIETYEQDSSAMGRIYAWHTAWNIATDRFFGGGFEYPSPEVMARYSPGPYVSVAHSIYFQALGEHGFIGLALFLVFWTLVWRACSAVRRRSQGHPELAWAYSLSSMIQASLVGYFVGGAFLNLAFWDMPYYLFGAVSVTRYIVDRQCATHDQVESNSAPAHDELLMPRPIVSERT